MHIGALYFYDILPVMDSFNLISPIDGRYRKYAEPLAVFFSEAGLMRYRVRVELEYLLALSDSDSESRIIRQFTDEEKAMVRDRMALSDEDLARIKEIEKTTNHDVKAVEYFIREKLKDTSLADCVNFIHFALTSEDVDNIARSLGLRDGLGILLELLDKARRIIGEFAEKYKSLPMLARTHGQPATPTTFGKEFRVFAARLDRQINQLKKLRISVKLNGASGNYNAHVVAYPAVDWTQFSGNFVEKFNKESSIQFEVNLVTTQIEPHDSYAELFDILRRINAILIDFNQDMWRYISDGWIAQKAKEGEVGSSTMPHKVNPIKFENSEGNLGIANALFEFFSRKLPVSRLQRDLSDSTVQRNFGVAFGHCLIGYSNIIEGLERVKVDEAKVKEDLGNHPEVIAEAIQTILRREKVEMPYEKLRELTRGNEVKMEDLEKFIDGLTVREEVREELKKIKPETYIGLAEKLASELNP